MQLAWWAFRVAFECHYMPEEGRRNSYADGGESKCHISDMQDVTPRLVAMAVRIASTV